MLVGVSLLGQAPAPSQKVPPGQAPKILAEGQAREAAGDLPGAAAHYERAIAAAPKYAPAYDKLGFVRGRQGRVEEALANRCVANQHENTPEHAP